MRVGLFCSSLPEPGRKPGGVDVFVDKLADRLTGRGHAVTMFSYTPAPASASYASVQMAPASYAHNKLARMALVPMALNRIDTASLDVLHLHGDDWFYFSRGVPTIRTFHGSALHEARTATSLKRRTGQGVTFGLEILASRLAVQSYMGAPLQGAPYKPVGVLPYGVDMPAVADTRRPGPPVVLFVGTWLGRKRGKMLFDAFHEHVLPCMPDAQLYMVCDHCPEAPNVTWWPHPNDAELMALYQRAWVFCLPSSYEGFGLPYVEAMGAGTPVVATPNPGAEFVLDRGEAGVIVSESGLGPRLAALLTDGRERQSLSEKGRTRAEQFSWNFAVRAHETAYERARETWLAARGRNATKVPRGALGDRDTHFDGRRAA